jgi:hypothetical protein
VIRLVRWSRPPNQQHDNSSVIRVNTARGGRCLDLHPPGTTGHEIAAAIHQLKQQYDGNRWIDEQTRMEVDAWCVESADLLRQWKSGAT